MIGLLKGNVLNKDTQLILIDINGVGYEVFVSINTLSRMPALGKEIILHTHLITREDAQSLYGFIDQQEKELFKELIKASGVGPKLAIQILSGMNSSEIIRCIIDKNSDLLVKVPGVGKKTAERIIIELHSKLSKEFKIEATQLNRQICLNDNMNNSEIKDAISALISLGYKPQDASYAINRLENKDYTSDMLIKQALKELAR